MPASIYQNHVEGTRVDFWSNLTEYKNEPKMMLLCDQELDQKVTAVSIPFFWWDMHRHNHAPGRPDFYYIPATPTDDALLPVNDGPPDVRGRFVVDITEEDCEGVGRMEGAINAVSRLQKRLHQRESYSSVLFQTLVPLSTRTFSYTMASLFPNATRIDLCINPIGLILDIVTLPLRLIALIPRIIQQHCTSKCTALEGMRVEIEGDSTALDLNRGVLRIEGVTSGEPSYNTNVWQGEGKPPIAKGFFLYQSYNSILDREMCTFLGG